jgi:prophage antirepressor-like protein
MATQLTQSVHALNNPFLFSNHEIRTALGDDGEAWFCAKDVFESIGVVWKNRAGSLKNTPEKWICTCYLQGQSGSGEVIFISEPAIYQALFRSNKSEALAFVEWVCEEVLPAIRRQGYYGTLTANQQIALRTQKIKLLEKLSVNDAFIQKAVLTSLHTVCNQLGEPMPEVHLLGKDAKQMDLEV